MAGRTSSKSKKSQRDSSTGDARASATSSTRTSGVVSASSSKLYPTVAVSDAVFAATNWIAVYWLLNLNTIAGALAACGFSVVGAAASFGVIRFGFAPNFIGINAGLAETSAFFGLPLVGASVCSQITGHQRVTAFYMTALVIVHAIIRGAPIADKIKEKLRVPFNLVAFIGPAGYNAYQNKKWLIIVALAMIVVAGVLVGADRDRALLGCLRENIFHYLMAGATLLLSYEMSH